jgi:hypothetical protein
MKIYVAAAAVEEEALRKKERQYETQFTTKICWKNVSVCLRPHYFRFVKFSFPVTCLMPY